MSLSHLYRDGEGHMDDDDDERENFEITDWDLQNEFNPNRQRHWQTKEEATFGEDLSVCRVDRELQGKRKLHEAGTDPAGEEDSGQ